MRWTSGCVRVGEAALRKLSAHLRYIGSAGEAAKIKALVNMVMNCNTAALAEGLGLGAALGLDLTMLRDLFAQTGAASRVLETDGEDMQNRAHDCYFSAAHAAKDSGIALALAKTAGLTVPLAQATYNQYQRLIALGKVSWTSQPPESPSETGAHRKDYVSVRWKGTAFKREF